MASERPHAKHQPSDDRREPIALSLNKRGHLWRFVCQPGEEASMVRALAELADDETCELDWFDAALVAYELGRRLEADAEHAGARPQLPDDHHRPQNRSTVQP